MAGGDSLHVMDADEMRARAASFGAVAQEYADYRPGYPVAAVRWLVGARPARVLELGAGTGNITTEIAALGHAVAASDTSVEMLQQLRRRVPSVRTFVSRAEAIPLSTRSVDVVVAAQAFHWFDKERALPEIARVLSPGGVLSVVWNNADFEVPWVRKVFALATTVDTDQGVGDDPVEGSQLFAKSETTVFRHWQQLHRASLIGFVASQSRVATMAPAQREQVLADVGALYDSYGRGPDGMLLPWRSYCYRARVTGGTDLPQEASPELDDGLLIDFC